MNKLERKILLYEIAECIRDEVFSENEMVNVLKIYEITEKEIETIFLDLYCDFYKGIKLAEGEQLLQRRKNLNNIIRNYENMSKEEKKEIEQTNLQDIKFIQKVSSQIAFYKNAIKVNFLTGQDIGKIGYLANVKECESSEKFLDSLIDGRSKKGVELGDDE